jgi:sugar diacid utilization regulator/predicted hydrocarbon binding protein
MALDRGKYRLRLPCTDIHLQKERGKQKFEIDFITEEGSISLLGSRRLMFPADAFGDLRKELIDSFGQDSARQILFRFGYQCGARDAISTKEANENGDTGILLGPFFHQIQGIVLTKNQLLQFNEDGRLKLMKGFWFNSYEAAQHQRHYGLSQETVCWSLAGYASGFASQVLNDDLLCIETECEGKGNDSCIYEIRPLEDWPAELRQQWLSSRQVEDSETTPVLLLAEKKKRAYQQQLFRECLVQISGQTDTNSLLLKLAYYAHRLVKAEYTGLFHLEEEGKAVLDDFVGNENILNYLTSIKTITSKAYYFGEAFLQTESSQILGSLHLLAVPLYAGQKISNVVVIVAGHKIDYETAENIKLLFHFCGLMLEKLQLKQELLVLQEEDSRLREEQKSIQQSMHEISSIIEKTSEFLNIILEGKGIKDLVQELGEQTQAHVLLLNDKEEIAERNLEKNRAEKLLQRLRYHHKDNNVKKHFSFPLLAGERKLGELLAVERHHTLDSREKLLLEAGSKIIALEILKEQETQLEYRFNFFELLISGEYSSREALLTQANKVGFFLDGTYQLIGLDVEDPAGNPLDDSSHEILYYQVRKFIKEKSPTSKILIFSNLLVIFLSFHEKNWEQHDLEALINELRLHIKHFFPEHRNYLVTGRICKALSHYPMAYRETKSCLSIMKRLKQSDRAIYFEKLGVLTILFEVEQTKLVDFVNSVLGPLIEYEESTGLELLPTLNFYVKNNFNIQSTARNHYISASTLKYRLRKIRDYTGIDLDDPEVRLNIQMALKLADYK